MTNFREYRRRHPMIKMGIAVERHNKRVKVYKSVLRWIYTNRHKIFTTLSILALTAVMMELAYIERGEFCIGGECLIPALAVLIYLADREVAREHEERRNDRN